jgi:poly(3-hydroxybutyrate) depolymerase
MHSFKWSWWCSLLVLLSLSWTAVNAAVLHKSMQIGATTIEYEVVLPNGYDATKSYPAILAFGGGPQTVEIDQRIIASTFRDQAERRGYIVVMPAAPGGQLFYQGSERLIPAFLHRIQTDYKIKGGKFRVAGRSNGGVSAFEVATTYPRYFVSITAFPGYLIYPTPQHIDAISRLCIHMFVGENDELGFGDPMQQQAAEFRKRHMALTYHVEKGQGHALNSLTGPGAARLFDQFDRDQRGCIRDR